MCAKRRSGRWGGHAECAGGVHGAFFVCCVLTTRSCGKSLATTHYIRLTTTYYLLLTAYDLQLTTYYLLLAAQTEAALAMQRAWRRFTYRQVRAHL